MNAPLQTTPPFVVKNVRAALKMTQEQFAEAMGVTVRAVQQWEAKSGDHLRRPNGCAVRLMAALLDGWRPGPK